MKKLIIFLPKISWNIMMILLLDNCRYISSDGNLWIFFNLWELWKIKIELSINLSAF